MGQSISRQFDNVLVRARGASCIASSVVPPFITAYWPAVERLMGELGLSGMAASSLAEPGIQERFLSAVAHHLPEGGPFKPAMAGWGSRPDDIRSREEFRANHLYVTFVGGCSRAILLGALETLTGRLKPGGHIDVQFREWDPLSDWLAGQERLNGILNFLQVTKGYDCTLTFFSDLQTIPDKLGDYIYGRPSVRVGWTPSELASHSEIAEFDCFRLANPAFRNLENLVRQGIWPHLLVPVSQSNAKILPELVLGLAEATRGGTMRLVPVPLLPGCVGAAPPRVEDFVAAVLAIYKDPCIPLRRIVPQSWVAARMDADVPLVISPEAAGAAVTVAANGDIYAGETAVGLEAWRLGNILEDGEELRWERLDAMAEVFSNRAKLPECQSCDWRYRCGGVDASVLLFKERQASLSPSDWQVLFQLYCAPRKALFEEALWDSVSHSAEAGAKRSREVLELKKTGISFLPAPTPDPQLTR